MKISNKIKKSYRNSSSYKSVNEFYKFIESLGADIIIMNMKVKLNPYDAGSYIKAELARPDIDIENNSIYDYEYGSVNLVWDKNGKLIKSITLLPKKIKAAA